MLSWLTQHPAVAFYLADDERLGAIPPRRLGRLWIGLLVVSFLWGLATIGLWHGGQWLFGQPMGMFLLPNLLVVTGILLVLYSRAAAALIRFLAGSDVTRIALAAGLLTLLTVGCLLVLRPDWHLQEQSLPKGLTWMRPDSKLDRVLLLLPIWGAWSMLILPQFRRPPAKDGVLTAVARGCGPLTAAILMGILLAATIGYFAYLPWTQLTIPAVVIAVALGGGLTLAKRNGAMDRSVLLATNLLTQLAMLLAVAANSNVR